MENPWIRIQNIASNIGLMMGSLGIIFTGLQLNNNFYIIIVGAISFLFFLVLFSILLGLLIDDYHTSGSNFKRRFLGIPY